MKEDFTKSDMLGTVAPQGKGKAVGPGEDGKFESPKLRASTRARVDEAAEFREFRDQARRQYQCEHLEAFVAGIAI